MDKKLIKSKRGKPLLILNKQAYNLDNTKFNKTKWRCTNRKCPGFVLFSANEEIIESKAHNHEERENETKKLVELYYLQLKAAQTRDSANSIIVNTTSKLDDNVLVLMPNTKSLYEKIRKKRCGDDIKTIKFCDFPDKFKKTLRDEEFYQYDSGYEDLDRFIIFYSVDNIEFLKISLLYMIDGTFKSVPHNFYQLLTISGFVFGKSYPLLYVLMSDKSQVSYERVFRKIREMTGLNLHNILIDYEFSLQKALGNVFANSHIHGCIFHHGQAIWRNLQTRNLTNHYRNDKAFSTLIKNILSLVFVPGEHILDYFYHIKNNIILKGYGVLLASFLKYYEKTYILKQNSLSQQVARYSTKFLSVFTLVYNSLPRTTNSLESFHRTLNFEAHVSHVNIGKFMEIICMIQEKTHFSLAKAKNGFFHHSEVNFKKEHSLLTVVKNFNNLDIDAYFDAINNVYCWGNVIAE